jgi:hypothetical protein
MKNRYEDPLFLQKWLNMTNQLIQEDLISLEFEDVVKKKRLAEKYYDLGVVFLILNEFARAKDVFTKSSLYATKWFDIVYPNYVIKNDFYGGTVDWRIGDFIFRLLFSGNKEFVEKYCKKILDIPFMDKDKRNYWNHQKNRVYCELALKNMNLDEYNQFFTKEEKKLQSELDCPRGIPDVISGLVNKKKELVMNGLNDIFKKWNRGYIREEEYPICPDACSIILLSRINDIDIRYSEIDKKYLKHTSKYLDDLYR